MLAGASHSLVSHIERGEVQIPRGNTLERIASVLGVTLDWLISGVGGDPDPKCVKEAVQRARVLHDKRTDAEKRKSA